MKSDISSGVPAGSLVYYSGSTCPTGYLLADGSAHNKASLTPFYGANLPDLRGVFVRGNDNGRGLDSGRELLSYQGDAIRNITGTFNIPQSGYARTIIKNANGAIKDMGFSGAATNHIEIGTYSYAQHLIKFDASLTVPTASENRPVNVTMTPCIKY